MMQVKNKVKQNLKQSKGCACETPLAEVFFFPGNGARKLCLMRHGVDGFSPSSWEPQEEGMMSTAENFPSVRNQGLSVQEKAKHLKVMLASLLTLQQRRH
jgi:hypothetical protein